MEVLSELISVARQARFPKLGSKPRLTQIPIQDSTTLSWGSQRQQSRFKWLWITIVIVYIYPLNGYRELDSYEEPCIYTDGNTITSFARELNPTGVGEHIYIYIVIHIIYIYIYMHICTYVCIYIYVIPTIYRKTNNASEPFLYDHSKLLSLHFTSVILSPYIALSCHHLCSFSLSSVMIYFFKFFSDHNFMCTFYFYF